MLKELRLKNFKSFREETVRFSPSGLTVLVGPNGCGKSSVLEALSYVALTHFLKESPLADRQLIRSGARSFELGLETAAPLVGQGLVVTDEVQFDLQRHFSSWAGVAGGPKYFLADSLGRNPVPTAEAVKAFDLNAASRVVPFPRVFAVDLQKLRAPLRPGQRGQATFDAEQVIQTIFDQRMGTDVDALNRLVAKVQKVVPAVRGFGIRRQAVGETDQYGLTFSMTTGTEIDASQVSEGTLLTVAILAATELIDRPTLLLIDDLDRALHPVAQRELVGLLRTAVSLGNLEIVCTTHSPYILGEFKYEEVRVLREVEGESKCMALDDGPEAKRWMHELDAGEYWSFAEQRFFQPGA